MNDKRQANEIGRFACPVETGSLIASPFRQIRRAPDFDPHNDVTIGFDHSLYGVEITVTKIVELAQQRRIPDTPNQSLSGNMKQCQNASLSLVNHIPAETLENQSSCRAEIQYRRDSA